jgi:hypothetical protein
MPITTTLQRYVMNDSPQVVRQDDDGKRYLIPAESSRQPGITKNNLEKTNMADESILRNYGAKQIQLPQIENNVTLFEGSNGSSLR